MDLSNTVLVTHRWCMDGSTCSILFRTVGGKEKNIKFTEPGHEKTDFLVKDLAETHDGPILIADISVSYDLAKELDQKRKDVALLDHHKSAIPLSEFDWCEIDVKNTRCGSKMLYDFFMRHGTGQQQYNLRYYEDLTNTADDYDRYQWKLAQTETIISLHDALKQDLFVKRFIKNPSLELNAQEQYLVDISIAVKEEYIERKCSEAVFYTKEVDGNIVKIAAVEAGSQTSELGNRLCRDPRYGADIAVMINSKSVSFRARQDCPVDLSVVAKNNGRGGGHSLASGTSVSNILGENFLEMVFSKIKWQQD